MSDTKNPQGQEMKDSKPTPAGEPIVKPKPPSSDTSGTVKAQGEPIVKP